MTMRAAGYVRVSTKMQAEHGLSLDSQPHDITAYCAERGWPVIEIYTDAGQSAYRDSLKNRPALRQALEAAERSEFDVLVVDEMTRFARNLEVKLGLMRRLDQAGATLDAVKDQIDYVSPQGRLLFQMEGAVAEYQSAQTGEHVLKVGRERARQGLHAGLAPFAEQSAVRECFERRVRGQSYAEIASWMNAEGYTTQRGNPWSYEAVRDLISNPYYRGVVTYEGREYEGQHEAIVSPDLWHRAQAQKRRRAPHSKPGTRGLLQGRAYCIRCNRMLHADRTAKGSYLYRERHRDDCATRGRSITARGIDEQVGRIIRSIPVEPPPSTAASLARAVRRDDAASRARASGSLGGVRGAQSSARSRSGSPTQRLQRAHELYIEGAITRERYDAIARESEAVAETVVDFERIRRAAELLKDTPRLWELATHGERYDLVSEFIEAAYVDIEQGVVGAFVATPELEHFVQAAVCEIGEQVALVEMRGFEPLVTPPRILWPDQLPLTLHHPSRVWRVAA